MIVVTGATGRMGRQVVEDLLRSQPADQITAAVRDPRRAADLAARGVRVRTADYADRDSLRAAFDGADRLLLISTNDYAHAVEQHTAAIEAAEQAKVGLLVFTSLVHADTTTLRTAIPHRLTEPLIRRSGLPFTLLRNNVYTEAFTPLFRLAATSGVLPNSAGDGRLATATRADYAAAATATLTTDGHAGRVYELGGAPWSFPDLAAALSAASGRTVTVRSVSPAEHRELLAAGGVPPLIADLTADIFRAAADGELADNPGDLERLIGRRPTPLTQAVAGLLAG